MHPVHHKLLHIITLFETDSSDARTEALSLLQECSRMVIRDTITDIIYRGFIGWLKSPYENSRSDALHTYHQELTGQSTRIFNAYISKDYTKVMTDQERHLMAEVLAFIDYLSVFRYPDDDTPEKQQVYRAYKHTFVEFLAESSVVAHEFDETVYHFLLRFAISTLRSINPFTYLSRQKGYLVHSQITLIGDLQVDGEDRYPNIIQDIVWARSAMLAIQDQAWVCFQWQIFPETILFAVR